MLKTSIKLLALGVLMFGAASTASACGDEKKDNAQASYTSTSGSTCASKMRWNRGSFLARFTSLAAS